MMSHLSKFIKERLNLLNASSKARSRALLETQSTRYVTKQGRRLLNFCSNDYLGLAWHPHAISALAEGAKLYGVGGTASQLVSGHKPIHHLLEENLAEFTEREAALVFPSGYMANLGVLSALLRRQDTLIADRLNHASLHDAGLLARSKMLRYRHADTQHCATLLSETQNEHAHTIIATDGLFSMDGDLAPLSSLIQINQQRAWLLVDDAHGLGVIGAAGKGSVAGYHFTQTQVPILIGTFGKALGGAGAFVAGSRDLIDYLIQICRPYIYTTALPGAMAYTVHQNLKLLQTQSSHREKLIGLIKLFRTLATEAQLPLLTSHTPIQPLMLYSDANALQAQAQLEKSGFWIKAIRAPSVPANTARLRITLTAAHEPEDITRLLEALANICCQNTSLEPC